MSLQGQITTTSTGDIVIYLKGELEYSVIKELQENMKNILVQYPSVNVTLDMNSVSFVGSSGIQDFLSTCSRLNDLYNRVRVKNLKQEFAHLLKIYDFKEEDLKRIFLDFENFKNFNLSE